VFRRVDADDPRHLRGRFNVDARDESMGMNATLESNVQSACNSTIVSEHALSHQQAPVFDALDPRPDIPGPQSNLSGLSHGTIRSVAAPRCRSDLASAGYQPALSALLPHLPHPGGHVDL
jgi:hypothetical protein